MGRVSKVDVQEGVGVGQHVPAIELDNDLAGAVVVDFLEFANVAYVKKVKSADVAID